MESGINSNRKIGIEIEFVAPIVGVGTNREVQDLIANVLTQNGIPAVSRGYSRHPLPRGCQIAVEDDASLQDESKYRGLSWSKLEVKTSPMLWVRKPLLPPSRKPLNRGSGFGTIGGWRSGVWPTWSETRFPTGMTVHRHAPIPGKLG